MRSGGGFSVTNENILHPACLKSHPTLGEVNGFRLFQINVPGATARKVPPMEHIRKKGAICSPRLRRARPPFAKPAIFLIQSPIGLRLAKRQKNDFRRRRPRLGGGGCPALPRCGSGKLANLRLIALLADVGVAAPTYQSDISSCVHWWLPVLR